MSNYGQSIKDKLGDLNHLISKYDEFYKNPKLVTLKKRERKYDDLIREYIPSVLNEFPKIVEYLEVVLTDLDNVKKENIELKKQKKSAYSKLGWGHYDHYDSAVNNRVYFQLSMKKDAELSDLIKELPNFGSEDHIGLFAIRQDHIDSLTQYYSDLGLKCVSYKKPEFELTKRNEDLDWDRVALINENGVVFWDLELFEDVSELKGMRLKYIYMMGVDSFSDLYEYQRFLK